jgi:hypothetical protein
VSRAKRRQAVRAGEDYEQRKRYEALFEELKALPPEERPDWFNRQDVFAKTWRPMPSDPAEQARLASVCRECGQEGHHRRECPNVVCDSCGQLGHKRRSCPQRAGS